MLGLPQICQLAQDNRDGGAGGPGGGALAPPLSRRMTFYSVLVYVVIRENTYICQMKLVFKLLLLD